MKTTATPTRNPSAKTLASAVVSILAILPTGVACADDSGYRFTAITYIGSPAPGGGAFTNDFEPSRLNNHGQLAFTSEPDVPGEEAIFLAGPEGITQIMRFGQAAPGGGIFSTFELGAIGLNEAGDLGFAFTLEPLTFAPAIYGGIYRWSHRTQTLTPIVVPNVTPAPGGGTFVGAQFAVSLNNQGTMAFGGFVGAPAAPGVAIFTADRSGFISSVAQPGDPTPDGGAFVWAGTSAEINDSGDVVFTGHSTSDPSPDTVKNYVRRARTGRLEVIPLPAGTVQEGVIGGINNRGQVLFGADYFVPDPSLPVGIGALYVWNGRASTRIVAVGDPAPSGGYFSCITAANVSYQFALNNSGDVAFNAVATNAAGHIDESMYLYSHARKKIKRVAGTGSVLPGIGTILSLEQGIITPTTPLSGIPASDAALNDRGQIAFAAVVTDGLSSRGVLLLATPREADDEHDKGRE
jgi:hypothetical protein